MNPLRKEAILTAIAKASIYCDPWAYRNPQLLPQFWNGPGNSPTRKQIRYLTPLGGYKKAVIKRIQQGFDDEDFSPWTGGFWHGLKLSGALTYSTYRWRINPPRPELVEDLQRTRFCKKIHQPDQRGRLLISRCYVLHSLPKNEDDPTILAGLFAGARLRKTLSGKSYYSVPAKPEVLAMLTHWGIAIHHQSKYGYCLSPFYATLAMGLMPPACACRALSVTKAVQCPQLPLAYWEVLFGFEGMPMPSRLGALPFICADITRKRHKWSHKILHQMAVRFGVAHVIPPMHQLIVGWRNGREMLYNKSRFNI